MLKTFCIRGHELAKTRKRDQTTGKARCSLCGPLRTYEYRAKNKDKVLLSKRTTRIKQRYGVTKEQYDQFVLNNPYNCGICGSTNWKTKKNEPVVDHCHKTGIMRGLLCGPCNSGLGMFQDNILIVESAIKYLEGTV